MPLETMLPAGVRLGAVDSTRMIGIGVVLSIRVPIID